MNNVCGIAPMSRQINPKETPKLIGRLHAELAKSKKLRFLKHRISDVPEVLEFGISRLESLEDFPKEGFNKHVETEFKKTEDFDWNQFLTVNKLNTETTKQNSLFVDE